MVPPDIGFEHGVERRGVVADDFLFDEEDGDVRWDGDFAHCDVSEEGGFTDAVAADEAVAASVGEGERGAGEDAVGAEVDVDGGEVDVFGFVLGGCGSFERVDLKVKYS